MYKTKGRLFADKINKSERKNKAEIIQLIEVHFVFIFWLFVDMCTFEN